MRLLFLSPYLPEPPQSGAPRRVNGLVKELGRRHEVSLLAFVAPGEESAPAVEATRQYCAEVATVANDRLDRVLTLDRRRKRAIQLRSLFGLRSYEWLIYSRPAFQHALDALAARNSFDAITAEHAQMGCYRLPRSARLVLDEHNIEYDILRRTTAAERPSMRKLYSWANYLKLRREEHAAWHRFDGVTLTSERDEALLQGELPDKKTAVIPNAVDTEFFRPSGAPVEPGMILFFGAINYYPNTEGLLYFLDEIFPRVKRKYPGAKLWIVGQLPPQAILARAAEDVRVTGLVDDVRPYIARAGAVIAPLRIGGGTRLKIVEAMAMGKAIVATHVGAEGLEVENGQDILLNDTPEGFAQGVTRVLSDRSLAQRLGHAARRRAESHYTWRAAVDRLERFYEELEPSVRPSRAAYRREPEGAGGG